MRRRFIDIGLAVMSTRFTWVSGFRDEAWAQLERGMRGGQGMMGAGRRRRER